MSETLSTDRKCPYCAESVKAAAITCRFCQRDISVDLLVEGEATPKQLHKAALNLLGCKPGTFSYQQLKSQLADNQAPLCSGIAYSDAQQLIQAADISPLSLVLRERHGPVEATTRPHNLPEAPQAPSQSRWLSTTLSLTVVVALIAATYYYLERQGRQSAASLDQEAALPTPRQRQRVQTTNSEPPAVEKVQEALIRATVTISDGSSIGSGFFIDADGYILTNAHVVEPMNSPIVYLENGSRYRAEVERIDRRLDVALLKVDGSRFSTLKLGDATTLTRGDTVWTIGAPHGLNFTLTKGIISYVGRNMNGIAYLQTDASINSGNSGGPMITEAGEVVGINTFIIRDAEGLGFALPSNYLFMSSNPILEGIVTTEEPHDQMEKWLAYADGANAYGVADNRRRVRPPTRSTSSMLDVLLRQSKELDATFQSRLNRANTDITRLTNDKKALEAQYFGENASSLSVSEETILGKKLKRLSSDIINRQIALLKTSKTYYRAKEKNIRQSLGYTNNNLLKSQLESAKQRVQGLLQQTESDLQSKYAELKTVQARKY